MITPHRRPLRVAHILTRFLRAGSEENTIYNALAQADEGHDVIIVHGKDYDAGFRARFEDRLTFVTLDSLIHSLSPSRDWRAMMDLKRLLAERHIEVVHTHQSKAGIIGRLAAKLARVPLIIHGIHILPFFNFGRVETAIFTLAERVCARMTDTYISVSPSVRRAFVERGIGKPDQHFVAFSPMEVDRFKTAIPPEDWRTLLGVAPGADKPPTVVMLSAFEPRKRHADFIRSIPAAFADVPDWRVVFAGHGTEEAAARKLVAELGLGEKVRFIGHRSDPERIIALADVCSLTSNREGLPRVLVQYAAAGKAIVATSVFGIEDILENGRTGIVVAENDVSAAVQSIANLFGDPVERDRLAAGALTIDVDQWAPAQFAIRLRSIYGSALNAISFEHITTASLAGENLG